VNTYSDVDSVLKLADIKIKLKWFGFFHSLL
jgi:hypothetical protein